MAFERSKILEAAARYADKKQYPRAVAEYGRVLQEDPEDARVLLKVAELQANKMGAHADAVATYEKVAQVHGRKGFALKAIAVYKQVNELIQKHAPNLEEKYAHVMPRMGELYIQLGLMGEAVSCFNQEATRLQRVGKYAEALDTLRRMETLDPGNPLPHLRLAEVLSSMGQGDQAAQEFAHTADALLTMGRRDDAVSVLERLLEHRPEVATANRLAQVYLERAGPGDDKRALGRLQVSLELEPRSLEVHALLCRAYELQGQSLKVLQIRKHLARLAHEQGQRETLSQAVYRLVQVAPQDPEVLALHALLVGHPALPPPEPPAPEPVAQASLPATWEVPATPEPPESLDLSGVDLPGLAPLLPSEEPGPQDWEDECLRNADALRRKERYAQAMEVLRTGLTVCTRSETIRKMLADVVLEDARQQYAVAQLLSRAVSTPNPADAQLAADTLFDVLDDAAEDERHQRTKSVLLQLGFSPPPERDPQAPARLRLHYPASAFASVPWGALGGGARTDWSSVPVPPGVAPSAAQPLALAPDDEITRLLATMEAPTPRRSEEDVDVDAVFTLFMQGIAGPGGQPVASSPGEHQEGAT